MDYSVGSLSDLITGTNTPNKRKVTKREIKIKINDSNTVSERKEKSAHDPTISQGENVNVAKKSKKRKFSNTDKDDSVLTPKKRKNDKNAEKRVSLKEKHKIEDPELLSRTVFVGNLPITSNTKKLKKLFSKYGNVEATRIRGIPVANPKISKKVAAIKKEFHPERKSFYGFVRFEQLEDAKRAAEANGIIYHDHHLRVHLCGIDEKPDENKAIFVGNLSFYAEEEDLWKLFESCGPISSVRIVRDNKTGIGKGFGYVNFQNSDSVTLALEMENLKIKDRELRISICNINMAKKNKNKDKIKKIKKSGKPTNEKEVKKDNNQNVRDQTVENKSYQGAKYANKKKKRKVNKGLVQKKKLIKKVAPK